MTVTANSSNNQYTGNGSTDAFAFSFSVQDKSQILVQLTNTLGDVVTTLTEGVNYTVAGIGNRLTFTDYTSGSVTISPAPLLDHVVNITRNIPITQDVNYVENERFPSDVNEFALDKLTMLCQQVYEGINRTLRPDPSGALNLPEPVAGKYLKSNSDGTVLTMGDGTVVSIFDTITLSSNLDNEIQTRAVYTDEDTIGSPFNCAGICLTLNQNVETITQTFYATDINRTFFRRKYSNTWAAWVDAYTAVMGGHTQWLEGTSSTGLKTPLEAPSIAEYHNCIDLGGLIFPIPNYYDLTVKSGQSYPKTGVILEKDANTVVGNKLVTTMGSEQAMYKIHSIDDHSGNNLVTKTNSKKLKYDSGNGWYYSDVSPNGDLVVAVRSNQNATGINKVFDVTSDSFSTTVNISGGNPDQSEYVYGAAMSDTHMVITQSGVEPIPTLFCFSFRVY